MTPAMTPLERLAEAVDQLTLARTHHQHLAPNEAPRDARTLQPVHGAVISRVPSLIDQLAHALPGGSETDSGHAVPDSRPQAHLDALDTLLEIDAESTQILALHGLAQRDTLAGNLRALVGVDHGDDLHRIARTAWAWRTRAAVITGWELPAKQPDNTCPLCGERGGLRVRLDVTTGTGTAVCIKCREVWDEDHVALLAEHMRCENGEQDVAEDAYRPHRTHVTGPDTHTDRPVTLAMMRWRARCDGCAWEWQALRKDMVLAAANLHRSDPLEVSA